MRTNDQITRPAQREIIEDFADEINNKKEKGPKPSTEVIYFRREHIDRKERQVYQVPIQCLRFRKDNGRITSDIKSYEKLNEPLLERSDNAQSVIRKFLREKDPELTKTLTNSILHSGQRDPAIITCDGFLINGNRRKLVLEELSKVKKEFQFMKVVILPGKNDPGGPPTLLEIEQIENRYQLQSEGKAEYYKFDLALSIRRKIELGMSLEDQLRDDPNYTNLAPNEFRKKLKEYEEDYLKPLDCIDTYLEYLGRAGLYNSISKGISDREGRWQAFLDYYKYIYKKLEDDIKRMNLGIEEDESGDVEEIAFKIIRQRDFPDMPKVHKIMRDLPKWIGNKDAKKELFKLLDIDLKLSPGECFDDEGNEIDERRKDLIWSAKHRSTLINQVKKARRLYERDKEKETPITLLEAALRKLEHENMQPDRINIADQPKAMALAKQIKEVANQLESEFFKYMKDVKKLKDKYSRK